MTTFIPTPFLVFLSVFVLFPIKYLESFIILPGKISLSLPSSSSSIRYSTSLIPTDQDIKKARTMMPEIVNKMPDSLPKNLKHKYYMLRHGQSTANIAEIISSSRELAYSENHGLTSFGYKQGKESANQLLDILLEEVNNNNNAVPGEKQKLVFVSSPFARAKQTAEACIDGLMNNKDNQQKIQTMGLIIENEIVFENSLMERYFGRLDADSIYTYAYVWPMDAINVTHTAFGVESVAAVCTRILQVVERCEEKYNCADNTAYHIVWVSHADVLQIGQLYAANAKNVGRFSAYRFKNGEVRAMKFSTDYLPDPVPLEAPKRGTSAYTEKVFKIATS